jgi:hypothetical protein
VSVTSSVACSSGLAAWWKFDECEPDKNVPSSCPNALASDSSGNGKHLRVNRNGGDPWTNSVGPKKGTGAFRLSDANNTYAVPNTNAGDEFDMRTSDRSVSFWLKIGGSGRDDNDNNDNDSSTNYVIFSKASSAPAAGRWYVASNSGGLFAGFQASAISLTTAPVSGLKDGKWHHILAVWDRDANLTLWVDGVSRASVNISASQETDINTTWPFVVGAYSSLTNAYKDLYVDDMKIFNSVVTPEQADSAGASSGTPPASPPSTSSFSVGSLVHTNSNGSNIHSEAGDGRIVGQHNLNDRGTITRGPTREDGLLWWWVDFYSGVDGWVWENNLSL